MLFRKISTILITSTLFSTVAFAEDLSYLPDPVVIAATTDQCSNTISKYPGKITNLCNRNISEYAKIDEAGIKLADKITQIQLTANTKRTTIRDNYDNKRDAVGFQIATLTARRAEILANCIGGIFGGGGDCTQQAAIIAIQITKLAVKLDQLDDKENIALAKVDANEEKAITKAEATFAKSVAKSESKIAGNNNKITTYNNAIIACNAPAVTCPAA